MEAIAKLNNVPTSPRKMRMVADLVRGKSVSKALGILKFEANAGAAKVEKLVLSALANWQAKNEDARIEEANLYIKTIFVDEGKMLKRLRPSSSRSWSQNQKKIKPRNTCYRQHV
ncbi:hypothetical protein GCM10028895_39250 [Pontibacter rugosus]